MTRRAGIYLYLIIMLPAIVLVSCNNSNESSQPASNNGEYELQTVEVLRDGEVAPLLSGIGTYHREISTESDLAQKYFDQGLRLTMGYYFPEAVASFQEALRHDPGHPMILWGLALAAGPVPNSRASGFVDDPERYAYRMISKAIDQVDRVTTKEKDFIHTLALRFDKENYPRKSHRDSVYLQAARDLFENYPNDPEAGALLGDALMTMSPWNYWKDDGSPRNGTREAARTLERVMEQNPDHPLANHLYIHLQEASSNPGRAEPHADRLEALLPGIGHIIHMPSHIYVPVGRLDDAVTHNIRSYETDEVFKEAWGDHALPQVSTYPLSHRLHPTHALDFIRFASSLQGNAVRALEAAGEAFSRIPAERAHSGRAQRYRASIWITQVVFGKWDEILAEPAPAGDQPYLTGMWRYARGRAYTATGKLDKAYAELTALEQATRDTTIENSLVIFNRAPIILQRAGNMLRGHLWFVEGKVEDAVSQVRKAVQIEDNLTYLEPPDWIFSARHLLGSMLLAADRPTEAASVYRRDLAAFQENGWALWGLWKSLEAQGRKEEAADVHSRYQQAWQNADVDLPILNLNEM